MINRVSLLGSEMLLASGTPSVFHTEVRACALMYSVAYTSPDSTSPVTKVT